MRPELLPASYKPAEQKFDLQGIRATEPAECRAGDVLRGRIKPIECAAFGTLCTPENPLGAPMVSSEGACAAYWAYARYREVESSDAESAVRSAAVRP